MATIVHVKCGSDVWQPTVQKVADIKKQFEDVLKSGGVVATRDSVSVDLILTDDTV